MVKELSECSEAGAIRPWGTSAICSSPCQSCPDDGRVVSHLERNKASPARAPTRKAVAVSRERAGSVPRKQKTLSPFLESPWLRGNVAR